jgi:hypothetical protein
VDKPATRARASSWDNPGAVGRADVAVRDATSTEHPVRLYGIGLGKAPPFRGTRDCAI